MNSQKKIPKIHFVGLGPGKAGTTYIYGYLERHPNVAVGIVKESYFFSREFYRGRRWYLAVKGVGAGADGTAYRAFGDISNQYFQDLDCIQRIESEFPNSKYIFFRREPLSRLLSCFKFEKKMGYRGNMEQYLRTQSQCFFDNEEILKNIYKQIPESSVFIVEFDLLCQDPYKVFDELTDFLCVPKYTENEPIYSNPSVWPRSSGLAAGGRHVARVLRQLGLYSLLQALKSSVFIRRIFFSSNAIKISDADVDLAKKFLEIDQCD